MTEKEVITLLKDQLQFFMRRASQMKFKAYTTEDKVYLDSQMDLCKILLSNLLQMEGGQMIKIGENEVFTKVVRLSDIKARESRGELEGILVDGCKKLDELIEAAKATGGDLPGGLEINQKLKYQSLANRLVKLRKAGKVANEFKVSVVNTPEYKGVVLTKKI